MSLPVVILATADFDSAVWTNKQHLASRLAADREVVYIESFGLRRPTLSRADLGRVLRRTLSSSGATTRPAAAMSEHRPQIISPIVVPLHGSGAVRRMNHCLVRRTIRPKLPPHYVLWSFSPLTYGLEAAAHAFVYHSVDLIHHQPHMPARSILTAESRAVRRADAVIASSTGVRDHLTGLGASEVRLWENVADTELFAAPAPHRRPRAIFAGHLTPTKIDVAALRSVVDAGVELIICGPLPADGTHLPTDVRALLAHPRTQYRGNRSPRELAEIFAECEVGLIPYLKNRYTDGVFPMKVYEYLASGLAVVSTPLPSLSSVPSTIVERSSPASFGQAVAQAVIEFDEKTASARRDYAASRSWESRTRQARALLEDLQ